jgi:hypothetical protein
MRINSADKFINPPELGVAEREVKRVPNARFILIPISDATRGTRNPYGGSSVEELPGRVHASHRTSAVTIHRFRNARSRPSPLLY